jgi:arsenate reductase
VHCNFPDPAKAKGTEKEIQVTFREVREMIKGFCKELAAGF